MDPLKVISPKKHLKLIQVLYDGVKSGTGFSIAEVQWDGENTYGLRWDESPTDKGYPCGSHGHPQWMIANGMMIKQMMSVLSLIRSEGGLNIPNEECCECRDNCNVAIIVERYDSAKTNFDEKGKSNCIKEIACWQSKGTSK